MSHARTRTHTSRASLWWWWWCQEWLLFVLLTSTPVTDSTLRLFFILIGSFWAPGRSVPEPRQQSRWRARTGEVKGHCKVKPVSDRVTPGPPFGSRFRRFCQLAGPARDGPPHASLTRPSRPAMLTLTVRSGPPWQLSVGFNPRRATFGFLVSSVHMSE